MNNAARPKADVFPTSVEPSCVSVPRPDAEDTQRKHSNCYAKFRYGGE